MIKKLEKFCPQKTCGLVRKKFADKKIKKYLKEKTCQIIF